MLITEHTVSCSTSALHLVTAVSPIKDIESVKQSGLFEGAEGKPPFSEMSDFS